MLRRVVSIVLIAINVLFICVGCCGCDYKPAINKQDLIIEKNNENNIISSVDESLKISAFQGGYGSKYWEELIKAFNKQYPNIKVTVEISPQIGLRLKSQIASCDFPDLIYHIKSKDDEVINDLIKNDLLLCLDDIFESKALDTDKKVKEIIKGEILESPSLRPYNDGKIYFAPFNVSPCGLIYNKTLFEKKGWKVPNTWDEFFEIGEIAKKENRALFVYASNSAGYFNQLLLPNIASCEGNEGLQKLFNYEDELFASDNMEKIANNIEILAKNYTLNGNMRIDHMQAQAQLMMGQALFMPSGIWIDNEMKNAQREGNEKFRFALLPCLKINKDDQSYLSVQLEQLCIPKGSKSPEAAKELIKFMYTEEAVKLFGKYSSGVMVTKNAVEIIEEDISENVYEMAIELNNPNNILFCQNFKLPPIDSSFSFNRDILEDGLLRVFKQEINADKWLNNSRDKFAQLRREYP